VKLTIRVPEKVSLNRIYAGIHFRQRMQHKEDYYYSVLEAEPKPWTGDFPIKCHYHFRLRGSRLDISNHAYMLKMIEDALVLAEVIPGDEPKYVSQISITAEKVGKDEDETVTVELSHYLSTMGHAYQRNGCGIIISE